eukprot:3181894-Prymnesium_polylepis.1
MSFDNSADADLSQANRRGSLSVSAKSRRFSPWSDDLDGGFMGIVGEGAEPVRYYVGIIDILTAWS